MSKPASNRSNAGQYILQSVSNALSVIDLLGKHGQLSVAEVAQIMNIGKTTAFRLLTTLENSNYISKDSNARYRLGMKLAVLGSIVTARNEIANLSHPFLEKLSSCFGETAHLVIWNSDTDTIVADRVIGTSPISYQTNIGYITRPAHLAASGQVLLAFASEEKVQQYFKFTAWEQYSELPVSRPGQLTELLKKVKEEQAAFNYGDVIPGLYCYAVPVLDYLGHAFASLSISGPEANLKTQQPKMIARLKESAEEIRRQLCAGLESEFS